MRWLCLGLALVAVVLASVLDWPQADAPVVQRMPRERAGARAPAPAPADPAAGASGLTARPAWGAMATNPFMVRRWEPPPAAIAAAPASAPVAAVPPLPFQYQGKLLNQGQVTVFLALGPRIYVVRAGDVVTDYKVVAISATDMTLLYMPLNETQRMAFGSAL